MDTNALKRFAQSARNLLISQVTSKLAAVIDPASPARRENPEAMKKLDTAIRDVGEQQVIEQVAYTWFNRLTALRFMDVNGYTNPRVVSPEGSATRPEILAEALAGNLPDGASPIIAALLDGRTPSNDPQAEAYRMLLVHTCNAWHGPMPFLFEKVGDYTELLMPEDLLSQTSVLARLREAMPEDACQDVEIIGWLYQFYISEKKDQVFAGLKKNQKITAENIPAATQLFTPHWIVRYLVENSLGRLWLLNRPGSTLAERMDYYIAPEEPETDFLKIGKPEEIKVCDPACGSGHMLTYAFDLLHAIYEEEGYEADKIPALILANNLTGVEIDDRAGALAAFALAMKAAARLGRRRFLRMEVKPDIVVLQNVTFTPAEMQDVAAVVGKDLFTDELRETLLQFDLAKNFGSLIVPKLRDPAETLRVVEARDFGSDLLLKEVQTRIVAMLRTAEALSSKYHVVVANPPYMGASGMNAALQVYAKETFLDSKSDLFAMFMERSLMLAKPHGMMAMINMQAWMFQSSYELLRAKLLSNATILTMAHQGARGFDTISGEVVTTTAFVFGKFRDENFKGAFLRLVEGRSETEKSQMARNIIASRGEDYYKVASIDFERVPGEPIAYWITSFHVFSENKSLAEVADLKVGLQTGDNNRFLRFWFEVSCAETRMFNPKSDHYYPYSKGGEFRKWYGNREFVINWRNDGAAIKTFRDGRGKLRSRPQNIGFYFKEAAEWSDIGQAKIGSRFRPSDSLFDVVAMSLFARPTVNINHHLAFLNSTVSDYFADIVVPGMHCNTGYVGKIPFVAAAPIIETFSRRGVFLAKTDWDANETSWDFTTLPLLATEDRAETLAVTYIRLRTRWQDMIDEMQRLEEENNRIFIDAYGLQDELTPEVPIEEITLTCNPAYRYGMKGSEDDRETRLRADTMTEFLSYAVGCMFGRYSLDVSGLILANQGETLADYLARIPDPSFQPDKDNVIPVLEGDWFADDISERFRRFLRVTFGEANFRENLAFIEAQIGDIRKYFTRGFFDDHVRRYKKRPIYWMFSSPKGTFQALIYMHRYRPDTVSILRNEYLVELIRKLEAERARLEKLADDYSASQSQRTRAMKDMAEVSKQIAELEEWEREVIFPLAQAKIEIDLDDGVKRNYPRFGGALKPIKGLEAADE